VAAAAQEQTLRTIIDHLLVQKADYRDLFTSRKTFMARALGPLYYIPVPDKTGWQPYEFTADGPRAGLLTQISFTSLYALPGRSSATLRGKAIREKFLCQKVPDPPANVDFKLVQDTKNEQLRTARARLTQHRTDPVCAGCHRVIDPIGLALEHFDGAGQFRSRENDVDIDASGDLDGIAFKDAAGLGQAVHDHPGTPACLVKTLVRYAWGSDFAAQNAGWLDWMGRRFAGDNYRLTGLMERIATSDAFVGVATPQ
jgi:hypothetical protein